VGSIWLMYLLDYNFSVAVAVGFIALAGVTVEIGILMLTYLNQSYNEYEQRQLEQGKALTKDGVSRAVMEGAGLRVRPVMMTAVSTIAGLLPIMFSTGTGAEVVSRIAAPMVGGMISAVILTLLVLPAVYYLWRGQKVKRV